MKKNIEESEEAVLPVEVGEVEEQLSSLDLLWKNACNELDKWAERSENRDEDFLQRVKRISESVKRNMENINEVNEQFQKELAAWEKTAREEFLMSTTSFQRFFPVKSYEEMNQLFNDIQKRTIAIMDTPRRTLTGQVSFEKYVDMIEHYVTLRKKARIEYIRTVKQSAKLIYENQKLFVNLFTKPFKTAFLPFNKYLEKIEEPVKS
ncbi:hypothetical protein CUU64_14625 [Bacillus sp. V5-8f]|nr:hypothetical protein CUU64_14625 [Bacillus sp. V5-8f]